MAKVLLLSEKYIKTHSNLNDNIWGEYLTPAIAVSQDIYLTEVIGSCLYTSLCDMVNDGSITADTNTAYKYLLDEKIRPYLMWQTITSLVPIIGIKLDNLGTIRSNDEHVENLSEKDRELLERRYQFIADGYKYQLQLYLKQNKESFPELRECSCDGIKPTLDSSNSSTIWLGGIRGRKIR